MNNTKTEFKLTSLGGLCNNCQAVVATDLKNDFPFLDLHYQVFIMAARPVCDRCGFEDKNHPEYPEYKAFIKSAME